MSMGVVGCCAKIITHNAQKICSRYFASMQDNKGKTMESNFDVSFRFLARLLK